VIPPWYWEAATAARARSGFKTPDRAGRLVLDRIDFRLRDGEIVAVLGKSGSGKSTFLRILAGLVEPSSGHVHYRGQAVRGPARGVAMVFQSFALFPWLTVLGNVELGLEAQGVPRVERRDRALKAIDLIGLDGFESAYPKELSGGMRQRVGLARALAADPQVLLLDEPLGALDALTRERMQELLLDLWHRTGKSLFLITHSIEEALFLATRLVVMSPRPGRIVDELTLDFGRRYCAGEPARRIKSDPDFIALRERVMDQIFEREAA